MILILASFNKERKKKKKTIPALFYIPFEMYVFHYLGDLMLWRCTFLRVNKKLTFL